MTANGLRMLSLWSSTIAFSLGLAILSSRELHLTFPFFVTGYLALVLTFASTIRSSRDFFNPLCLILAVGFIRFSLSAFLSEVVGPEIEIGRAMGLRSQDWHMGHVLALTGLLGVVLGWFLVPGRFGIRRLLKLDFGKGVAHVARAATVVGFLSLLMFVASNASIVDVVITGAFRGLTIQEGTGKYFYFSHLLISGSVILSGYLLVDRRGSTWVSLSPVVLAALSLWVLGGRGRALTALLAGVLFLWYWGRVQSRWAGSSLKPWFAMAVFGLPFLVWAGHFGELYRGGMGIAAFLESLSISGLWQYLQWAVFTDVGQLHPLAGAVTIAPGILPVTSVLYFVLWPLSQILDLPGRSTGTFIVETLAGFGPRKFGLHSSLIGDAYLTLGLPGVIALTVLFGLLAKLLYLNFRRGSLHGVPYVLATVYSIHIFFAGLIAWPYGLVVVSSALIVLELGSFFTPRRSRSSYVGVGNASRLVR